MWIERKNSIDWEKGRHLKIKMKWVNDHFFDMDHLADFLAGFDFLAVFDFLATFLATFLVLGGAALLRVSAMVLVFLDLACFLNPASLEAIV